LPHHAILAEFSQASRIPIDIAPLCYHFRHGG
jgi:hypothetical protein